MAALKRAKCGRIYQEKASGAKAERPELMRLLDNARKGDTVVVWKLDRLARSLCQLIDTTVLLNERGSNCIPSLRTSTPGRLRPTQSGAFRASFVRLKCRIARSANCLPSRKSASGSPP